MKRVAVALCLLVVGTLACGQVSPAPAPVDGTGPTATGATQRPAADASTLWYLTRGDVKSDQAWGVDIDSHGNVYVAAYMQSPATKLFYDTVVHKFSPEGKELWRTQWGGELQEKAFIVTVSEPLVFVGGLVNTAITPTEADMEVLALDMQTGQVQWTFTWGQGFGYEEVDGLVVNGDSIYVSGWTTGEKSQGDLAILKLDRSGKLIWAKTWGGEEFDEADGQMVVDQGAIYVTGRFGGANLIAGGDAVLAKFSKQTGDYMTDVTWGGAGTDDGLGMTSDGTFLYVVGLTTSYGQGGQIFLLKYTKDLKLVWQQIWGGPKGESARAVEVDTSGNIVIAGSTASSGNGQDDILLLKYTPEGEMSWSRTWGGPLKEAVHGMVIAGDYAYLAGNTDSYSNGQSDALVIKADILTSQFPTVDQRVQ